MSVKRGTAPRGGWPADTCPSSALWAGPRAASRGDQIDNARLFGAKGYGLVVAQEDLTPESLLANIPRVLRKLNKVQPIPETIKKELS